MTHERFETCLDAFRVSLLTGAERSCGDRGRRKLDAYDARHLQKLSLFDGESVQPALDERTQTLRDSGERRGSTFHDPVVVTFPNGA